MEERGSTAGRTVSWRRARPAVSALALGDNVPAVPPGQAVAFGELAELHRAHLLRVAHRLSGNPEIAKDLVQDTLLRALDRFDQFRPGTHAATWLVTILTNLFLDHLRHQKVERRAEPELAVAEAVEPELALASITDVDLHAAVGALEPELRQLVELCYLKQMRYREVATALRIPMGTIGTRLMRARARLRELLGPPRGMTS
jgi:RNA polymerase sigma-70 factor, ECF subfamily